MLKLIALLLTLILVAVAGIGYGALRDRQERDAAFNAAALSRHWQSRALRWEARADSLYDQAREADRASAHYAELMVRAEGKLSQCGSY